MVGQNIAHYRLTAKLGAGGMGEVYLADDTRLDRRVALKVLPTARVSDEQAKRRLLREAKSAATLDHPNICAIYEVGEENGRSFIAMQFVEGETLAARLERKPLDIRDALDIANQVTEALASAHSRGIVHRDIKPQNIMISGSGLVKVLDFGLAKRIDDRPLDASSAETASLLTEAGLIIGTVPYMSPEQVRAESLDGRSDVFSFGVVLYEMLSGVRPFVAKSTAELISAILTIEPAPLRDQSGPMPARLDQLVRKCLSKQPASRYQTMEELLTELKSLPRDSESGQLSAVPITEATRMISTDRIERQKWRGLQRHRVAVVWTIAALVLAASVYALFFRSAARSPGTVTNRSSSPAYDAYLRGKVMVNSENREDTETAIKLLEQATNEDRNFAPAFAELARAYNVKAFYFAPEAAKQLELNAQVANEKALALEPNLAEGHFVRGLLLWTHANRFPHEQAIQSYKQALALNPNLDEAHHQLGLVYLHIGLFDKAWAEIEKALEANPGNMLARFRFGVINLYRGRYEDSLAVFNSTPLKTNPTLWAFQTATAMFQLGRNEEAKTLIDEYLQKYPKDEGGVGASLKAMMQAKAGNQHEAKSAIEHANEIGRDFGHFHHAAYNIASAYALMNDSDEAMRWLQKAADDGFPCYPLFESDANLNSLRKGERFIAFMSKLRQQWERWQETL